MPPTREISGLTNAQIGKLFSISYSAVSRAVKTIRPKLKTDHNLVKRMNALDSEFNGLLPKHSFQNT
jgi:predicted transcriptional regulator